MRFDVDMLGTGWALLPFCSAEEQSVVTGKSDKTPGQLEGPGALWLRILAISVAKDIRPSNIDLAANFDVVVAHADARRYVPAGRRPEASESPVIMMTNVVAQASRSDRR